MDLKRLWPKTTCVSCVAQACFRAWGVTEGVMAAALKKVGFMLQLLQLKVSRQKWKWQTMKTECPRIVRICPRHLSDCSVVRAKRVSARSKWL